ncbi:MAG: hypothetical protein IH945_06320 [Armatimonadetes bacterium]|nr:hypothetical protein [Armatimonadota bacterium]
MNKSDDQNPDLGRVADGIESIDRRLATFEKVVLLIVGYCWAAIVLSLFLYVFSAVVVIGALAEASILARVLVAILISAIVTAIVIVILRWLARLFVKWAKSLIESVDDDYDSKML